MTSAYVAVADDYGGEGFSSPSSKRQRREGDGEGNIPLADDMNVTLRLFSDTGDELNGAPIVVPAGTTVTQLERLYHQLHGPTNEDDLQEDDVDLLPPVQFRAENEHGIWTDIENSLRESLSATRLTDEKPLELICLPQAIFHVRPVTRCTASLPGHGEPVISVQFSPDGSGLASGSGDTTVRLWDLQTQLPFKTLEGHKHWVLCISWSPDGRKLASACKQGTIIVWDPEKGTQIGRKLTGHKQWVNALAWKPLHLDPNSRLLASAGRDATVRIWDTQTFTGVRVLSGHTASITTIRWGGSELIYSGSQDRSVKVWRDVDGVLCRTLVGHAHWINTLALNVDHVLRIGFFSAEAKRKGCQLTGQIEDATKAQELARRAYEKALNGQPERLVSGSDDFTMFLWEPVEGKQSIARMTGHQQLINQVCFSPDTRFIASASFDKSIKLWEGRTGKFIASLRGHVAAVYQIAWSADSRMLVSASADSTLKVWNIRRAKLALDLPGHGDEVFAVDWSPNGDHVVSGGKDKLLKLWKK